MSEFFATTSLAVGWAFIFGTCIGSFLNVLIWRLPREKGVGGRSECPNCKHELAGYDLVPVLSYIFQKRKCRYCEKKISPRYALIEIVTGLFFGLAMYLNPVSDWLSWILLAKLIFVISICIVVFVIDLEHYLILDRVIYPAIFVVAVFAIAQQTFLVNFLSGVFSALPFFLIWFFSKGKWMGLGDVKYLLFMGLALGFPSILVGLFLAFTIGAIVGVGLILAGKKEMSSKVPFGTFLTIATILALLWGPQIWQGYWRMFML